MTKERLRGYAETLAEYPQYKLRIAFRRLKFEWKAKDFGFPLISDVVERMCEIDAEKVHEWTGPSELDKINREKERAESADWWAKTKAELKPLLAQQRMAAEVKEMPRIHMSDAEESARREELRLQAKIVAERYGK